MKRLQNFVNGAFQAPIANQYLPSFNPATGEVYLELPRSDGQDIDQAVRFAKKAFPAWAARPPSERAAYLYKIADRIDARREELALAESMDQGKPVWLATAMDIPRAAQNFRFFAGALLHAEEPSARLDQQSMSYVSRQPVGVAGLISPWNLPLYLLTWKIAPALAFGNTAVCKPSEITSATAAILCEICVEVGLPAGVLNIIFGNGPEAGSALVAHPEVPLISFTGGTATGRAIAGVAAPMFKKLSLELGGKNANLIFADADLSKAVEMTVRSSFLNQGEICLCGSRIYVHQDIYEHFLELFIPKVMELHAGDPSQKETFIGPLASKEHLAKVQSYLDLARKEGAEFLAGGDIPKVEAKFSKGYFLRPTVLSGVAESSRLIQEEIFGPVVTVAQFSSEAEAIHLANGTNYGLSAAVWTTSLSTAHRVAEKLEAGTVWVNTWMKRDLRMPFGGVKASGVGREGQYESREFFTEAKTICLQHN